ncbi:hypothetical protein NDI39_02505 [Microcoleus sp. ZQ-A2]|nr:hypothetical protein [Microcoleus sp. FACHB-1]
MIVKRYCSQQIPSLSSNTQPAVTAVTPVRKRYFTTELQVRSHYPNQELKMAIERH